MESPPLVLRPSLPAPSTSLDHLPELRSRSFILFRHPAYQDHANLLLRFPTFDQGPDTWGVHHSTALAACRIVACNMPGFLSLVRSRCASSSSSFSGPAIPPSPLPPPDEVLTAPEYYFYPIAWRHLPHPPDTSQEEALKYPVCPDFENWRFPHESFPVHWLSVQPIIEDRYDEIPAPSQFSGAVGKRDGSCRVSGFVDGSQCAHLVPRDQSEWFHSNEMSVYNVNDMLPPKLITCDIENLFRLRQDIHTLFDAKGFVFVPKANSWRIHFLSVTRDYGRLFHNREALNMRVAPQFLFARFAWAVFGRTQGLANRVDTRIRVKVSTGNEWVDMTVLAENHPSASLTDVEAPNTSTKRQRENPTSRNDYDANKRLKISLPGATQRCAAPPSPSPRPQITTTKDKIFNTLTSEHPSLAWSSLRWHPDLDRINRLKEEYLTKSEPIRHAVEAGRLRRELNSGFIFDSGGESGDDDFM